MSLVDDPLTHDAAHASAVYDFAEIPGLRGLRLARLGQKNGQTLDVIEGAEHVVIPAMTHPSAESGRVLQGALRFMREGVVRVMHAGDSWRVEAGEHQGPHIVLENGTRIALLRDGRSAFDT